MSRTDPAPMRQLSNDEWWRVANALTTQAHECTRLAAGRRMGGAQRAGERAALREEARRATALAAEIRLTARP